MCPPLYGVQASCARRRLPRGPREFRYRIARWKTNAGRDENNAGRRAMEFVGPPPAGESASLLIRDARRSVHVQDRYFDSQDLGEAEEFLGETYARMRISSDREVSRTRVQRRWLGPV